MARRKAKRTYLTQAEWDALPLMFEADVASRVYGTSWRWTIDHATELGGRKVANRWLYSKREVAAILGIEG